MRYIMPFILVLVVSACATLSQNIRKPEVSLTNVQVSGLGNSDMTLVFNLALKNPNAMDLRASGLNYQLELNGKQFAQGELDEEIRLEANGESTVKLPIQVQYQQLFESLSHIFNTGKTQYNLTGDFKFGLFKLPFSKAGEVDIASRLR